MRPASHGYRLYPVLYGYHCAPYGYISMPYTPWLPPCTSWLSRYPDPVCPEPHGYLSVSCTPWLPPVIFGLLVLCTLWSLSSVLNLIATSCTLHFMATSLHPIATTLHTVVTSLCPTPNGYQPVPCILWLTPRTWIPLGHLIYSFIHGHPRWGSPSLLGYLHLRVCYPYSLCPSPCTPWLQPCNLPSPCNPHEVPEPCTPWLPTCISQLPPRNLPSPCTPLVTSLTRACTPMLGESLPLSFIALCASIKKPLQW